VSEAPIPEIRVDPDHFDVITTDAVLVAELNSTFALCLYDAVLESGALIHLRVGPPGRVQDPELTDTSLSTDLLLLDRCFAELRKVEPRAQHWQAKVVGQVQDSPGARERFDGVRGFLSAFLDDTDVKLISCDTHVDHVQLLRFRPAMGHVRTEPLAASRLPG
jgi:chemotaxis receptor (MCP) glutamine deamidase CheD